MAGVASEERDLGALRHGLQRWFRDRHPGRAGLRVGPLVQPSSGFSSLTLLVDLAWDGGTEGVVVRLPPAGRGLFPVYDLSAQARIQAAVGPAGIPVAAPLALEEDVDWVGAPFLVMARVAGNIPGEQPPYWVDGWLHDAPAADQARLHDGFLDVLAGIHRLDWDGLGLGPSARPGGVGLAPEVAWWADYLYWAGDGSPSPDLVEALEWCRERMPGGDGRPAPPASLLWGDVRLGNVVFDDAFRPAAVLDWEMASIGPAELDVAWYVALRRLPGGQSELPGLPGRDDTLRGYERRLGRALVDLPWFEVFALLRSEAILERIRALWSGAGVSGGWLDQVTPMRRRLARLTARV